MFGNTIEPMSYLGFWGLGLLMSLQGSFIWCNGITSATSTFSTMLTASFLSGISMQCLGPLAAVVCYDSPRSNQNHFTSLSIPGVRLGNHVLRLEHFRCDVFSDPTSRWTTSWLASYSLWGWLMMSYTALAAKVDAMLATAICWLLASTRMLICACKTVLSSCSSSRVFFGPLQVFSWFHRVSLLFQGLEQCSHRFLPSSQGAFRCKCCASAALSAAR